MVFVVSPSEQQLISKVREALVDLSGWGDLEHDAFILRWLKSQDMDFEKTKLALQANYKWRQENGMDTILKDYIPDPELSKILAYEIVGYDKENCPVITFDVQSAMNPKKLIKKYGKDGLAQFARYNVEKITQACRDKQTKELPVQEIIVLCDSKKFTFKQLTSPGGTEMALDGVKAMEAQYPLSQKLVAVVNAPKVSKLAYKIVKPFLSEKTVRNVKLFPKCNAKVKKLLLQYIDADELPQKYGGNKKIGEAGDSFLLNDDDECSGNPDELEETDDLIEAKVPAGKKLKLEYQVDQPKTQICWSFQTDDREIGFTVYYGEKEETLLPYEKFGTSLANNSIVCEKTGKYTLCFNNKENRFRSTSLSYVVTVFPPGSDDE